MSEFGKYQQLKRRKITPTRKIGLTENPLAVGDHDGPDVILRPVAQNVVDVALVVDRDEQTLKKKNN